MYQPPTSTSNPYLSSELHVDGSYNPLCVQSHDTVGFGIFPPYDDEEKPSVTGFHPINSNDSFGSLHLAPRHHLPYEATQHDEAFGI